MEPAKQRYRKLPGTGYRRSVPGWAILALFFVVGILVLVLQGRRVQLWEGEEHLLLVEWDGRREYYKRFKYNDIQSVILRKSPDGLVITIIFGIITALFGALTFIVPDIGGKVFLGIFAALACMVFGYNLIQGHTCKTILRTAVQSEELVSLDRLRRARKAMERLKVRIATAQGSMTPEEVDLSIQYGRAVPASRIAPASSASAATPATSDGDAPPVIAS